MMSGINDRDIQNSGITAGTYTNPTVTFNAEGIATAASNGISSSLAVTESIGSGADANLTTAYATVPNISLTVPANQAVDVDGLVELTADSATGADDLYVQLYDTVAAAAIANSERHISYLPAGKRGLVTLEKVVPGASAGRTLVLQARNATAARGSVSSARSLLQMLSVSGATSTGSGASIVKPPYGTALRTSGTTLINGLVLCCPVNEASGTVLHNVAAGTAATLGSGWTWGTDSSGFTALLNSTGTVPAAVFSGITPVTGDFTILAMYAATNPGNGNYTTNSVFGQGQATWDLDMDAQASLNNNNSDGSYYNVNVINPAAPTIIAGVGASGVGTIYSLASGSVTQLGTASAAGHTLRTPDAVWQVGGGFSNRYFRGSLTYACFWNRALTSTELSSLAQDPFAVFTGY